MSHHALPWLIGGGAAALALYLASQSQADQPPISTAPQFDPAWRKKYSIDPYLLIADQARAKLGIETLKPGQLIDTSKITAHGLGPGPVVTIAPDQAAHIKQQIQSQQAFAAKWGIKETWAASELIEAFDKNHQSMKLLFRFPIANDAQAKDMPAMDAGRLTIVLDTVEAVQYFSGVLLLAMLASFDPKKGTINLDKPMIRNLMRLFAYHDWRVSEALAEYQLDTLNRFVGAPIETWLKNPDGTNDNSEIDYFESMGPYWAPSEPNFNAGQWYRCVPNEYPGMNISDSPTADPSYYMKKIDPNGDNFRPFFKRETREALRNVPLKDWKQPIHWEWTKNVSSRIENGLFKDHLGAARPFAKKILSNGRLWLFEYAALRMQNILYASTMINGVSDLAGQALTALIGAVSGVIKLAAGDLAGGAAELGKAILQAIGTLIQFIMESLAADQKNEALQRAVESHLNTLLSMFWGIQGIQTYLSGYQLGLVQDERFQEGFLHAGYRFGASRSASYFMRNWILVHDGGVCAYMHLPQIPLFMRGVPFAVITSATREHLYAVETVYGYLIDPKTRARWASNPPPNLTVPVDAQGPVGVRILEIHRGTSNVRVVHGPGAGGPAIPLKLYNPGFGLPGRIANQTGGPGNKAVL